MGSSASAVNMWYIEDSSNGTLGIFSKRSDTPSTNDDDEFRSEITPLSTLEPIIQQFNKSFGENLSTVAYAQWPNPFIGLNSTTQALRNEQYLKLVDGSENGQVDPLWSLIQPARGLDFIISWDNGGDARPYHWNNGTALYETYQAAKREGIPFPVIPSSSTFIKFNYTHKPVFFGCDARLTTTKSSDAPIVLYLANAPYSSYSNFTAGQAVMPLARLDDVFVNSFNQITGGNGTLDKEFAQCLGCAAIDRSAMRVGMKRTAQCQRCMERHCWHGESVPDVIVGPPEGRYIKEVPVDLEMVLKPGVTFAEWNATEPPLSQPLK
jgi:lysophospholipase